MELRAHDVPALDDRDEALAVVAPADDVGLVRRPGHERVHVVEGGRVAEPVGQRRRPREGDGVPADVRDLRPAPAASPSPG